MPIHSPEDLRKRIDVIIEKLELNEQREAANRLRRIQEVSFATSSEWLGELGLTIRAIQKEIQPDHSIEQAFDEIMVIIKKTWPAL